MLKRRRFATQYDRFPTIGEHVSSVSKTIPDQSLTIREIMDRFARGLTFEDGKVPIYEGEEDAEFPHDFHTWDYAEKEAYIDSRKEELENIKQRYKEPPKEAKVKTEEKSPEKEEPAPEQPKEK